MSVGWPFVRHCESGWDGKGSRLTLVGSFVLSAAWAHAADNGCKAAYDDGTRSDDVARCEAAAKAGGPNAEFEYGLLLWSGHNSVNDKKAALDWFRLSARQGHYLAQIMLGKMLSDPNVEPTLRNPIESYAWFGGLSAVMGKGPLFGLDAVVRAQSKGARTRPGVSGNPDQRNEGNDRQ